MDSKLILHSVQYIRNGCTHPHDHPLHSIYCKGWNRNAPDKVKLNEGSALLQESEGECSRPAALQNHIIGIYSKVDE